MAETPTDPRYPPGNDIDFDSLLTRLLALKVQHFPQHTARDRADPYIQLLVLLCSIGQHAFGRVNHALLQFSPKTITSRRALIGILEVLNRPLLPIQPARGFIRCKLKDAPVASTELMVAGARIAPTGTVDPLFTIDESHSTGTSVAFSMQFYDDSAQTFTALAFATNQAMELNDAITVVFEALPWDGINVVLTTPLPAGLTFSMEFFNEEIGTPDTVFVEATTLRFIMQTYLGIFGSPGAVPVPLGLFVTVTHKTSRISETAQVTDNGGNAQIETSYLGQTTPSASSQDYEVFAEWRPIPDASLQDETVGLSANGQLFFNIATVFDETHKWIEDMTLGGYAIRMRIIASTGPTFPQTINVASISNDDADFYVIANITQGERKTVTLGQTDGTAFQHLPVPNLPISDPIADPEYVIVVGTDDGWFVVDDFSNSGSDSQHAIFREDVDTGYGIQFGDGVVGLLPTAGEPAKLTYRTGSIEPGDLDANAEIKALAGLSLVDEFILPRGTSGYAPQECSDRASVIRFRQSVLPQLALRAESCITSSEIVQALTGGAPYRPTFTTSDGRSPFSRALFSTTGAGERQYRVIVVGDETDNLGTVYPDDVDEAEEFLNGVEVGIEIVGGHGPANTEAIVSSFSARLLIPTITITIADFDGVRDVVDQIIRGALKPHARDEDDEFRWSFGGNVPVPVLFGLLWAGIPDRVFIDIEVMDLSTLTIFAAGDTIDLEEFELPAISPIYDKNVNIVLVAP